MGRGCDHLFDTPIVKDNYDYSHHNDKLSQVLRPKHRFGGRRRPFTVTDRGVS